MVERWQRLLRLRELRRRGDQRYSLVALFFGLLLPSGYESAGAVAWLRGWPRPDLVAGKGRLVLGNIGLYPGTRLHCADGARIEIGDGTYLNHNTRCFARERITIGRDCMISWRGLITDCHGEADAPEPVEIGEGAWIGSHVTVLGGTRLGPGCTVAAGSVVRGAFPAGSVLAGKPAEVVAP